MSHTTPKGNTILWTGQVLDATLTLVSPAPAPCPHASQKVESNPITLFRMEALAGDAWVEGKIVITSAEDIDAAIEEIKAAYIEMVVRGKEIHTESGNFIC